MATTISKLAIKLVADANGVRTGTLGADRALTKLARRVNTLADAGYARLKTVATSTFGQIVSAQAAVGVAHAAWHASIEQIGAAYERVDERAKRARQLGAGAQDLGSIEYLAARSTTLNSDGVFDSIRAMNNRIANASINPDDVLNDTFGQLGLDARELLALPLEQRFMAIATAISEIDDASQRSAMTAKLFEETGSAWAASFGAGPETLRQIVDEYERLHGITSDLDASQIEAANDAMGRLSTVSEGFWDQIAANSGPGLTATYEKMADALLALRDAYEGVYEFTQANQGTIQPLAEGLAGAISPSYMLLSAFDGVNASSGETAKNAEAIAESLKAAQATSMETWRIEQQAIEAKAKAEQEAIAAAEKAAEQAAQERARIEKQTLDELTRRAETIRESLRDPFTQLAADLVDALDAVDEGVLSQSAFEQFAQGKGQDLLDQMLAEERQKNPIERIDTKGPGSIAAGSQAALSAIAAQERGMQAQADRDREAARQRKKQSDLLRKIHDVLQKPRQTLSAGEIT